MEGEKANTTKLLHDWVMLIKSPDVKHSCDYCEVSAQEDTVAELTEDDVKAAAAKAVADAIAPLEAKIAERDTTIAELTDKLGERTEADAITKAVADAVAPLEAKVTELTDQLDKEVIARGAAENENKALVDWLEAEAATAGAGERRAARIVAVKDTGIYPDDAFDETVAANKDRIDRWAEMEDDVFDMLLDGYKAKSPGKAEGNGDLPTGRGAMTDAVTEGAGASTAKSPMKSLLESTIPSLASAPASN